MQDYLHLIDTHTTGPRYDVTPLFADGAAFAALLADLDTCFAEIAFDAVTGIDALGFILGAGLALRRGVGFIPIRKGGKLPVAADSRTFTDYTGILKALELRHGAIAPGMRILLADEWIETGAQATAAIHLIEGQGGVIAGIATIHIDENQHTRELLTRYNCQAIWQDADV